MAYETNTRVYSGYSIFTTQCCRWATATRSPARISMGIGTAKREDFREAHPDREAGRSHSGHIRSRPLLLAAPPRSQYAGFRFGRSERLPAVILFVPRGRRVQPC